MAKKQALGRGLGALIDGVEKEKLEKKVEANLEIEISAIEFNPFQPRTRFDETALNELADSIKQLGIVQPLTVREIGEREVPAYSRRTKTSCLQNCRT